MSTYTSQSPFLDVQSFALKEGEASDASLATQEVPFTPFLSLYETEEGGALTDPEADEFVGFLNELYEQEFDESLFELVDEAAALVDGNIATEQDEDPKTSAYAAERVLDQHFAPLVNEAQAMIGTVASQLSQHQHPNGLTETELDSLVDHYRPSEQLNPTFENFFGKLKKLVKKAVKKGVALAKKGISVAAKLGLGPILNKLKSLIKPLLKKVIKTAISRLPSQFQPLAKKLAERIPFLKELEESDAIEAGFVSSSNIAGIQHEFNHQVANLLFAPSAVEQDLEVAQVLTEASSPIDYSLTELDLARNRFVDGISRLKEGEDATPYMEQFVPALLPALKVGVRLIGRKRVVNFLAKLLAKLIRQFVGPQYAPALSQAIVDAGLRLISLEATPEDEASAASSAVAATVEETVRRVAMLPGYVLDNQELLEGFALEAFEQAAAANLPPVLSEETYRKRPDLREAAILRGTWLIKPLRGRKRYKKYSRVVRTKITPHKASAIESFDGTNLAEFLQEQFGAAPGEDMEADVHLYESIPGTWLPELTAAEASAIGLGSRDAYTQLHPLTPEAAGVLLGEPRLGREVESASLGMPYATEVGQRLYYLEIPGKRALATLGSNGQRITRRSSHVRLVLDFPSDQILVHLYLSEVRAQEIAVKLRQHGNIGTGLARLSQIVERGLRSALTRGYGLKIVHETVTPDRWLSALRRLPTIVPRIVLGRVRQWVLTSLAEFLKQQSQALIAATEEPADGITLRITISNPPGFAQLRQAFKGKVASLTSLRLGDGAPKVSIHVTPGHAP